MGHWDRPNRNAWPMLKDVLGAENVMAAFEELGDDFLRPTFDALDRNVSYDQLHLWRLIYQVIGAAE
jgi:hypothetical protein